MIYVERRVKRQDRARGSCFGLDLERYDFSPGSQSLTRATEGTILDRLPPRIKIRQGAALELPHILVLIDDPQHTVNRTHRRAQSQPAGGLTISI